ncbi:DUF4064 domain-containing protein [Ornithinibacillus halophilus]|uniref:DUF4064 domain-containing protein n=1 Tax=Ornithinibacillus halophilus TaxID=930117 RepID=A0A1M5GXZ1_9BACI|nr:DUF4064 domain-containing protein [Ornithinibacillus halophilus]SHG08352.1 Protein of unknown function [Ornithinibacillus halophilus]
MKRTGEVILGIVGAVFYSFLALMGVFAIWLKNNPQFLEEALAEAPDDLGVSTSDIIEGIGSGGTFILIAAIIAVILGIVAMVLLKGNKQPKIAGIIFIATALVFAVVTFGAGIFAGLFYVIAGIMCFARKPKTIIEE